LHSTISGNSPATISFDSAIHAASLVGPAGILAHAGNIGEQIVHSTSQLLDYCKVRQAPLIYLSSAEVYGHSGILDEEMDIRVPCRYNARLEYALGKLTCESMLINSRAVGLFGSHLLWGTAWGSVGEVLSGGARRVA